MGTHEDLLARHRQVLPSWMVLYYQEPIALVDGEGRRVTDAEGNEYLDFFGGILTTMTGYKIPEVVAAIKAQADKMLHTSTLYLIENQIDLAERIAEPSGIPEAKSSSNSGTEANYRRSDARHTIPEVPTRAALRGSYHARATRLLSSPAAQLVVHQPVPLQRTFVMAVTSSEARSAIAR